MARITYQRRPLTDGAEAFIIVPAALGVPLRLRVALAPADLLDGLLELVEQAYGITLPEPQLLPARSGGRV